MSGQVGQPRRSRSAWEMTKPQISKERRRASCAPLLPLRGEGGRRSRPDEGSRRTPAASTYRRVAWRLSTSASDELGRPAKNDLMARPLIRPRRAVHLLPQERRVSRATHSDIPGCNSIESAVDPHASLFFPRSRGCQGRAFRVPPPAAGGYRQPRDFRGHAVHEVDGRASTDTGGAGAAAKRPPSTAGASLQR